MRHLIFITTGILIIFSYQNCSEVAFKKIEQEFGSSPCAEELGACGIEDIVLKKKMTIRKDSYVSEYAFADMNGDGKTDLVMSVYDIKLGMGDHYAERGVFGTASDKICWDYYDKHFNDCEDLSQAFNIPGTCMEIGGQEHCQTVDIFKNRNLHAALEDVNGDGHIDILTFGQYRSYIHYNNGNGQFENSVISHQMQGYCYYPYTNYIDLNNDGKKDFIYFAATTDSGNCAPGYTTYKNTHDLHITLRDGEEFVETQTFTFEESDQNGDDNDIVGKILYFDSDDDGIKDLFVLAHKTSEDAIGMFDHPSRFRIYKLKGKAQGFAKAEVFKEWIYERRSYNWSDWDAVDINNDGKKDFLLANRLGETHSFVSKEDGSYSDKKEDFGPLEAKKIILADMDLNGSKDLNFYSEGKSNAWSLSENTSFISMDIINSPRLIGAAKWYFNPVHMRMELIMGGYFDYDAAEYANAVWYK